MARSTNNHQFRVASRVTEVPLRTWRTYLVLWPLLLLMGLELLAFSLSPPEPTMAPTRFSVLIAATVLLTGVMPALLRPGQASMLFGCFAVLLAAVLWLVPLESPQHYNLFVALITASPLSELPPRFVNSLFLAPLALHITARFPQRSRLPSWIIVGGYAVTGVLLLAIYVAPTGAARWMTMAFTAFAFITMQFAALWLLIQNSRDITTLNGHVAQQARVLLATILTAELPLLLLVLGRLFKIAIPYDLVLAAQVALPAGIGYAILRHNLFEIDAVLRRTLAYTVLSVTLLAIYFGLTSVLTEVLRQIAPRFNWLATFVGLFVAAAAFAPLRTYTQALIDQLLYPERVTFQHVLNEAHLALTQTVRREAVVALLTDELPHDIGATWAVLTFSPTADVPSHADIHRAWSAPLVVGGQMLGRYWLGPRHTGLPYAEGEQEQLHTLIQQAALALAYVAAFDRLAEVNRDLEERVAMRTAHLLVQQRELAAVAERQRIARDLHDSVKQTLFSLGLGLRAVRQLLATDLDAARRTLETQEALAVQAQVEMGTLLAHLRTPRDGSRDLVEMLATLCAEQEQQQQLHIALQTPPTLVLPAGMASELLLIAREALHNVLKHSGTRAATVTLVEKESAVVLTVVDEGRGFERDGHAREVGHGIRGMRERAAGINGTLEICSAPSQGTAVTVRLARNR